MPTLAALDRGALAAAVKTRLEGQLTGVDVFLGEPLDVARDRDGYVGKYAAVFPGAGTPTDENDLAEAAIDLDWPVQVTCAAGWVEDVLDVVTAVHAALFRWEPTVTGLVVGRLAPPDGYDPGPVRYDRDVTPHRPFLPLQYVTRITAT